MGCYRGTVLRPRGTWYVASANKPCPYQILPHTINYVRCLYTYLDLLPQGPLEHLDSCRDSESSYSYGVGSGMGGGYVWEARVRKYAQRLEVFSSAKC